MTATIEVTKWLSFQGITKLEDAKFPEEMTMKVKNSQGQEMFTKKTKVKNFKWGSKVTNDQFVIDSSKARYFRDADRHILVDKKTKKAMKD